MTKLLIGDFAITKCDYYGNYDLILSLGLNAELKLNLNPIMDYNSYEILVQNNDGKTTIGVLSMSDSAKNMIVPYLKQDWNNSLYECRISKIDVNAGVNERLKATVWIKKNK